MDLALNLRERRRLVEKAATAALLKDEVEFSAIVADTTDGAVALTLPVVTAEMNGYESRIVNKGANNLTVVVAAGFGGGGAGDDTITLTLGEMCLVWCDGTYWYELHHTAAA